MKKSIEDIKSIDPVPVVEFPDELWILILRHLETPAQLRFATVSSRWRGFLAFTVTSVTVFSAGLTDAMLRSFAAMRSLYFAFNRKNDWAAFWVDFSYESITNEGLASLVQLETLRLPPCTLTDTGISCLSNLTFLELAHTKQVITERAIRVLTNLKTLKVTNNCRSRLSDDGVSVLTNLTSLTYDGDHGTRERITKSGIGHLTNLTKLRMHMVFSLTDAAIRGLTRLRTLEIFVTEAVTNAGVSGLVNLEKLYLQCHGGQISDVGIRPLTKLRLILGCCESICRILLKSFTKELN
jgi:Leucine-rich repeat (LRR) protein